MSETKAGDLYTKNITEDGTSTFFNSHFLEAYHSKVGAYREALEKHVLACQIPILAKQNMELNILDFCFGLGYNSLVAIEQSILANPKIFLEIIALENDLNILQKISECQMPKTLKTFQKEFAKNFAMNNLEFESENYSLKIILGDARSTIKTLQNDFFDAVFFDPFSPKACPELWSSEIAQDLVSTAKSQAYISTYSSSRIAKTIFKEAKCQIFEGPKCGRRNGGVLAQKL